MEILLQFYKFLILFDWLLITFIVVGAIMTSAAIIYAINYYKLKEDVTSLYRSGRIGFYTTNFGETIVEVTELEKFKNGYSRIAIRKIARCHNKKKAKDNFTEIVITNQITWLERDETVQEVRRKN